MKRYRFAALFLLWVILAAFLLSACGLTGSSGVSAPTTEQAITEAVRAYLAQQGSPADQVEVEVEQLVGDFARVKIISTDPAVPGGFTGFLQREEGVWSTLIVGSGFNLMEIQALGIPENILPEGWVFPDKMESAGCPAPTTGTLFLVDEARGYCLLYPASHTVEQLDSGNTEIVVDSMMNHIDPRVSITVEDLAGRTLAQAVDDFLAGYEGFEIEQSELVIAGEKAIRLDGIPGQDYYRKVLIAHYGSLYQLSFAPYDESVAETFAQAEQLYATVIASFRFTIP